MDSIDEFYLIINSCLDSCVPVKTYRFSKPYELYIPAKYRNKLKRLQNRYFKSNNFTAVAQIIIIFDQIKEKHRSKAINEELLALNTNSKVQNLTLLFNKHTKATRNVDIPCIQHNITFIYNSKTIADLLSGIFANGVEIISGSASRVIDALEHSETSKKLQKECTDLQHELSSTTVKPRIKQMEAESCSEGTAMEILASGTNLTCASPHGHGLQQAFYEYTL
ncbi:unnamed protein product [Schistosoma margrebowiei]|uniref:Uncharacterized protein n=1 Tax=Schistosoma margrebowiei TaxID=48269 RepID=A0A183LG84_9TREM|nr:unnamed protein product [Schistosoma margrebowiei]